METLRFPAPNQIQNFFAVSIISPASSLTTLNKKTRYKLRKTHFSFAVTSELLTCKTRRITARFGRRANRQNSLRKKLTHDLQVRQVPLKNLDPFHHFVDNEAAESNLASNSLEQGNGNMGAEINSEFNHSENSERFGESDLWNKLDSWAEQYKRDMEFWGIGSNPIFTVFQGSDGNVERVLVDEGELLRRSGVDPLYFRERKELEHFDEVNSKISHANFLAREIECGRRALTKNSSIAKFVITGENSGFLSRIRNISLPPSSQPKLSRVGVAMVCGFLFVWVMKKLFTLIGSETEVTRFDKEMLRRKIKSRMEKERLHEGNVEVIEEPTEIVFTERPCLDKEELLNSIRKAKGLNNERAALDSASHQDVVSAEMDPKIQEIQIMARHARKIERGEYSPVEGDESNDKTSNELHMVEKTASVEPVDSVEIDELKTQTSEKLPAIEIDTVEEQAEGHINLVDGHSNEFVIKPKFVNGIMETEALGDKKRGSSDATSINEKESQGNENFKPRMSERIIDDKRNHMKRLLENHRSSNLADIGSVKEVQSSEVSTSQLWPSENMPVRRKPKIILSVKEARRYLSQKHHGKPQVTCAPTTATGTNEGTEDHKSHLSREDWKAPDSCSVDGKSEPVHTADVCGSNSVKANEYLADDINKLSDEPCIKLKFNRPSDTGGAEGSIDEFMHSHSNDNLGGVPGENAFHAARVEGKENFPTGQHLEKVDELDELPKYTNLGQVPDLIPGKSTSHDTGISSKTSKISGDTASLGANLEEEACFQMDKSLDGLNEINETLRPVNPSESSVPVSGASGLHGSSSEENTLLPVEKNQDTDFRKDRGEVQTQTTEISLDFEENAGITATGKQSCTEKEKWLEKKFHEIEPVVKKIGAGFRNNYMVAREKVKQEDMGLDFVKLRFTKDDMELEWMQDDKLRDIVFRVRENELAGRDPFHSMDPEDKIAFLKGLENKVEKENENLSTLHEWLHSNIENVDYGADGISLYDPPEKVIPRWKGPPIDKIPEFLTNTAEQQEMASFLQKANESQQLDKMEKSPETSSTKSRPNEVAKISKTVIEASDGSIKRGKKSKKEYWQHTKKWSRGFVESYNAETDPEMKSVMKDIGKGLDRWITEKEIQAAADLMDKIPQRGKEYIEKKLNKLKSEMEQFGPAAVVSKYREYAEEKEEDYLWWLDLRYVLCIELYTYEGEDQRVGFYSLEMAADLELDPKPHHVIAFEDASDCKNLCYIIQAHLEMLGSGKAFVVAQPPKDVFWQAKANGFGVTVIRKGEVTLNVDLPLEEVEELITEIGSKMYHDKIMRERSVDISMLMKGVFGISKPSKRKRKKRARRILGK